MKETLQLGFCMQPEKKLCYPICPLPCDSKYNCVSEDDVRFRNPPNQVMPEPLLIPSKCVWCLCQWNSLWSLFPAGVSLGSIVKLNHVTPLKTNGPAGPAVLVTETASRTQIKNSKWTQICIIYSLFVDLYTLHSSLKQSYIQSEQI